MGVDVGKERGGVPLREMVSGPGWVGRGPLWRVVGRGKGVSSVEAGEEGRTYGFGRGCL